MSNAHAKYVSVYRILAILSIDMFLERRVLRDDKLAHKHCIVDFGRNTYGVMEDVRTFEDIRLNDFRVGRVIFNN